MRNLTFFDLSLLKIVFTKYLVDFISIPIQMKTKLCSFYNYFVIKIFCAFYYIYFSKSLLKINIQLF